MSVLIRKAEPRDAAALAELDLLCFAHPWSLDSFEQELCRNRLALYIVAEDEKETLIGYAGVWIIVDEGHITNIAVHPDARKNGVGTRLLEKLISLSEEIGARSHTLEVRPSNIPALALYHKFGFTEAGRRKGYYEDNGEDALILWRNGPKETE